MTPGASALPRVLLVEDDASIRRLVGMALEDEALLLQHCVDVEEAVAVLSQAPVQLLIADLMLPGRSGFDLLEMLQAQPALRGPARLAVFSAGLTPERRERLRSLGVSRCFDKPIAVKVLVDGVRGLLGPPEPVPTGEPLADVADPFAGDEGLRQAFLETCLQQWPLDRVAGDEALAAQDWARLQRVAHSLKGSLRLLGEDAMAEAALVLERQCAATGGAQEIAVQWRDVAQRLALHAQKVAETSCASSSKVSY